MDCYESIRKLFKKRRIELNMLQMEVAEKADISNNFYSNIERGKTKPSVDTVIKVCRALNLSLDEIIFEGKVSSSELILREITKDFDEIFKDNNVEDLEIIIKFVSAMTVILKKIRDSK